MTTTTTAASNGSTDTDTAADEATGQPEKPFGMALVREAETYHDASVLHDAVFEANQLCTTIQHAISDAYAKEFGGNKDIRSFTTSSPRTGIRRPRRPWPRTC